MDFTCALRPLANAQQGTLIGTIVDWATAKRPDKSSYLIPLGLIYIVPFFLALGMLVSYPHLHLITFKLMGCHLQVHPRITSMADPARKIRRREEIAGLVET